MASDPSTNKLIKDLAKKIDNFQLDVNSKFDKIDSRFEAVDSRFQKMDSRFQKMDSRFQKMDSRFQKMDSRFEKIETSIDFIRMDVKNVEKQAEEIDKRNEKKFSKVMDHIDGLAKGFKKFDEEQTVLSGHSKNHTDRIEKLEEKVFGTVQV